MRLIPTRSDKRGNGYRGHEYEGDAEIHIAGQSCRGLSTAMNFIVNIGVL